MSRQTPDSLRARRMLYFSCTKPGALDSVLMAKCMLQTGEGTKLCLFFSFLCDGSVSRGGKNSEGLCWLPSPVLDFYWLRTSCFLIGKRIILDQRKAAEVVFMLGWQLAIAYTWREGSWFTGNPALKFWPDSWSHP